MFYKVQKVEDFVLVSRKDETQIFCTNILSIVDEWNKMAERMMEDSIQYGDGTYSILDAYTPLVCLMERISDRLSGLYFEGYLEPTYHVDTRMKNYTPSNEYLFFVSKLMETMIHLLFVDMASCRKKTTEEIVDRILKSSFDKIESELHNFYRSEISAEEFLKSIKK